MYIYENWLCIGIIIIEVIIYEKLFESVACGCDG